MTDDQRLRHAIIYRQGGVWMLDCASDPSAANVRALFETTVLPMPYTAIYPEEQVRARLAERNPGILITRGDDR
jgi:hypothetical protein